MSAGQAAKDEAAFRDYLAARGCASVGIVEWEPGRLSPEHVHEFTAVGLVIAGGFTLRTARGARRLAVGDRFELAAGTPHVEDVGPEGARILSGRLGEAAAQA
jgi:quercetin dioxygenase-like cupin family protein